MWNRFFTNIHTHIREKTHTSQSIFKIFTIQMSLYQEKWNKPLVAWSRMHPDPSATKNSATLKDGWSDVRWGSIIINSSTTCTNTEHPRCIGNKSERRVSDQFKYKNILRKARQENQAVRNKCIFCLVGKTYNT